jgi:hypothetical protein
MNYNNSKTEDMSTIQEYSLKLANKMIEYNIKEYFNKIHHKFYSDLNIDFMDYFLSLIPKKHEFCVEQEKLQEYHVLNSVDTSQKILRALEKFNLKENVDYLLANVGQQSETSRGIKYSKVYTLTPHAFKLCLIRAKNSFEYANYYLMLEEIFYYYKEYQTQYQEAIISNISKDNKSLHSKIDEQTKQMTAILKENKDQTKQIEELLKYGKTTTETLQEVKEELTEVKEELIEVKEELIEVTDNYDTLTDKVEVVIDIVQEISDRSVPTPEDENNRSEFVLLQRQDNLDHFTFIRGIKEYNQSRLENRYAQDYNIIIREYNANPIQLYKLFKSIVKEEYCEAKREITQNQYLKNKIQLKREAEKIQFHNNKFELVNDYSLDELLDKLKEVSELKFARYNAAVVYLP